MNCDDVTEILKNLRICDNRIRSDLQYLITKYTPLWLKDIQRFLYHQSDDIKVMAMRLLRRLAIQDTEELNAYYLQTMVENGLVKICERHLIDTRRDTDNETVGNIREQMLWFLGYFAKSGVKWYVEHCPMM